MKNSGRPITRHVSLTRLPSPITRLSNRRRTRPRGPILGTAFAVLKIIIWLVPAGLLFWCFTALRYDFPFLPGWAAFLFLVAIATALIRPRQVLHKALAAGGAILVVLCWWFTLRPSNDRPWQPDVEQTAWAEVQGDRVTLHNVRNCDYRTETDYTPRWETRTVNLPQLTGVDLAVDYWGSPMMAHPIVSFQFADSPPVCFSIETRKEIGESYSALRGFFRQYELIYIVADERDVIRLRTNFRKGEDVYLYRMNITPQRARERFLSYITSLNELRDRPRWYNALTTNCTTSIRTQQNASERTPWDWRIVLNGKGDQMLFDKGRLVTDGLTFTNLKSRALINPAAQAAGDSPDFSALIRAERPGFGLVPQVSVPSAARAPSVNPDPVAVPSAPESSETEGKNPQIPANPG